MIGTIAALHEVALRRGRRAPVRRLFGRTWRISALPAQEGRAGKRTFPIKHALCSKTADCWRSKSMGDYRMRAIREFILDCSWPRLMSRLKERNPRLYWVVLALQLAALAAAAALGAYLDHSFR